MIASSAAAETRSTTPEVHARFDDATNTVSYIVVDPATREAAIIDPVLDYDGSTGRLSTGSADALLADLQAMEARAVVILETHAHADHLTAAHYLRARTGVPLMIGDHIRDVQAIFAPVFAADDVMIDGGAFDRLLHDGDSFAIGKLTVEVLHTPGHTPACLTYRIGDAAFVGDTLFMPDYGTARADFPGGDAATLYRSIRRILSLPPETRIFVGHDYLPEGRSEFRWETTVAEQHAANVHVHDGIDEQAFVEMRTTRDRRLAAPRLIVPSLQVNIRGGALPPAEADGAVFLRVPVNGFPKRRPIPEALMDQ